MNEYETPIDHLRPVCASDKTLDVDSIMKYDEMIKTNEIPKNNTYQQQMMQQQQSMPIIHQPVYIKQEESKEKTKKTDKEIKEININDFLHKDNIYLILAISILFSEQVQKYISQLLPNLYFNDKTTFIGLILHAVVIILGLYLSKKIDIKFG